MANRDAHKVACKGVKKAQEKLDEEERTLRAEPPGLRLPANVFEEAVGRFWGIIDTRYYMRARYGLIEALLKIKTFDVVQAAFEHAKNMLRLCRSDNSKSI